MWSLFKKVIFSDWGDDLIPTIDMYKSQRLVVGALLGSIAVILQSAGIFTGIGYILSVMSTAPLVLVCLLSLRIGVITYFISIFLLVILQPSEVLIFTFTTGLLGLSLGIGFKYFKRCVFVIPFAALCLTVGICILLYGFKFSILGPSVITHFNATVILGIFAFSLLYSSVWKKLSIFAFKGLYKVLSRSFLNGK